MSQTPFTIKLGKFSKKNKKTINPLSLLLYVVKKHDYNSLNSLLLWYSLPQAENECYKLTSKNFSLRIIMVLKHLVNKLHEALTVRCLSHTSH